MHLAGCGAQRPETALVIFRFFETCRKHFDSLLMDLTGDRQSQEQKARAVPDHFGVPLRSQY